MKVGIAGDHWGVELKARLVEELKAAGHEVVDFGAYEHDPRGRLPRLRHPSGPGGGLRAGG